MIITRPLPPIDSDDDTKPGPPESFPITRASELSGFADTRDFVEGLLTEGGASVIYGRSNCGKSFWAMDLAVAVATGEPFRDELEIEPGAVVYVGLEGKHGVVNRIQALKSAGKLPTNAPLFLCTSPVSLLEPGHAERLAETVKAATAQSSRPCRLVVLDTLARAMAGGDENSGPDMTTAVASIDAVRAATGAHVCLIHHCGKDEARGARGHSSLRAAVDSEFEVSKPDGGSIATVRVMKQRDLPMGEPMPFSLKVVELGTDHRGRLVTSCVVRHEDAMMATEKSKPGRKPKCTPEQMLDALPAATLADWQRLIEEQTGLGKTQFNELKKGLAGRFHATANGIERTTSGNTGNYRK